MTSGARPVRQVVLNTLVGDAPLMSALGVTGAKLYGVFNGRAPQNTLMPYVVLGDVTESGLDTFTGSGGVENMETIHVWSGKVGSTEVLTIYEHVKRLLHRVPLTVAGLGSVRGRIRLVTVFEEEERGLTATHGVVQFNYVAFP